MNHPPTTVLYGESPEKYEVLHAADLDIWVAHNGDTIIVMKGAVSGHNGDAADADSDDSDTPAGVPSPDETRVSVRPKNSLHEHTAN